MNSKKPIVLDASDGDIPKLRSQGYSLQSIGDRYGVTKERIRQILERHYPDNLHPKDVICRGAMARVVGCSDYILIRLERQGTIHPLRARNDEVHLYRLSTAPTIKRAVEQYKLRPPDVELVCQVCEIKFTRRPYYVRPQSPGRFCSRQCRGTFQAHEYGFVAHPENATGAKRKHNHELVYALRDATGWGCTRIGRELGIPEPAVSYVLRERKKQMALTGDTTYLTL